MLTRPEVSMPRRRLLAVVVAGVLALPALAACRDLPSVAAYVGSARLTNAQVDKMVAEFPDEIRQTRTGQLRRILVSLFVTRELSQRLAQENGISVPGADAQALSNSATDTGLKPDSLTVRLDTEETLAFQAIARIGSPQVPTEADKREVFQALVDQRQISGDRYDDVKAQLDSPELRQALGLRSAIRDALHKYEVTVNPRYEPLGIPIPFTLAGGQVSTSVLLSLRSTAPPAVVDRS
jgi:hypothetical protein